MYLSVSTKEKETTLKKNKQTGISSKESLPRKNIFLTRYLKDKENNLLSQT